MMLAGIVGPSTSLKAIHAALASKANVSLYPEVPHGPNVYRLAYDSAGYDRHIAKLGYGTWQMFLVGRDAGFMPVMSRAALWKRLTSAQFTTPLLKRWLPWIENALIARELLVPLSCFNCDCGWLKATTENLDSVVSEGLSNKELLIS